MAGIFISYRREDSAGFAGRLADDLKEWFAADTVFMDVTGIAPGLDFRKVIEQKVGSCDVLLAVIGKAWLSCRGADDKPRLDDPRDFVHLELASALKRDIPVVPVLVDGAVMPVAGNLPPDLEALAWRNAVELRHAQWKADLQSLTTALRAMLPPAAQGAGRESGKVALTTDRPAAKPRLPWKLIAPLIAILVIAVAALTQLVATRKGGDQPPGNDIATKQAKPAAPVSEPTTVTGTEGRYPATLPAGAETTLDTATYKILSARLERRSAETVALIFYLRMTSNGDYGDNFWDSAFRLKVGDELRPPINKLNELVAGKSAVEGEIAFAIDPALRRADLQISHGKETTLIPVNFAAAKAGMPYWPLRTRLPGPFPIALRSGDEVKVYSATVRILSAEIDHYNRQKLKLALKLRMTNHGRGGANFWDSSFRLLVDGVPRAPVSGLNEVVDGNSSKDGEVVFVFDDTVESLVLLVYSGKEATRIPLDIKAAGAKS